MTLVVARQVDNEVYVIGDTKFSEHEEGNWSETKKYIGGLKVVLLAPGICVGFAGVVEIARRAIQGFYDQQINLFDKNLLIEYFLQHHRQAAENGAQTDFVIAVIAEANEQPGTYLKEIFRIADSQVYWENEATQIGDKIAFNNFQEFFHRGCKNANMPTFQISKLGTKELPLFHHSLSTAMSAMQGVIDNTKIHSVDGFCTVVISDGDQFRYVEYIQIRGTPKSVRNESGAPVTFGGAAEGSDHKHVGIFSGIGHGIFPVYSITGRFGLIYQPEKSFEPTIIRNCTAEEFCIEVKEELSIAHQKALAYQNRL
jgi:hypothetical protein